MVPINKLPDESILTLSLPLIENPSVSADGAYIPVFVSPTNDIPGIGAVPVVASI